METTCNKKQQKISTANRRAAAKRVSLRAVNWQQISALYALFHFFIKKLALKKHSNNNPLNRSAYALPPRTRQEGVPEGSKFGVGTYNSILFTCAVAKMTPASPRDAGRRSSPLSTHGKDYPGLGDPNTLKLLLLLLLLFLLLLLLLLLLCLLYTSPSPRD